MLLAARFCCCLSLETGLLVWGYLGTASCVILLALNIVLLAKYDPTVTDGVHEYGTAAGGMFEYIRQNSAVEQQTTFAIMIAICLLGIFANYMVVMAVQRRNRQLLLPWMALNALSVGGWTILLLPTMLPFLILLSPLILGYYVWWCMYSMYQILQMESCQQMEKMDPTLEPMPEEPPQYYN